MVYWGLYGDCSTTRRYPGDYLEIVVPLGDTWKLLGDCSTTNRNLGDYIEIVVKLGDVLRIIWRL